MSQWLVPLLLTLAVASADEGAAAHARGLGAEKTTRAAQSIVDELRERLGIRHSVTIVVVPSNPYLFSVETPSHPGAPFVVRVEERMSERLSSDELQAALAHELGHVWVFTHHPYLQTEQLANEVAMRAVSREALARVYRQVRKAGGSKGDLSAFLGPEPARGPH